MKRKKETRGDEVANTARRRVVTYYLSPRFRRTTPRRRYPSLEEQFTGCREIVAMLKADVVGEYVDEEHSGRDRPNLDKALAQLNADREIDYLVVYSDELLGDKPNDALWVGIDIGMTNTILLVWKSDAE